VGASTAESAGGSERKGPTNGPHGSERERVGERTGFCADERDPQNSERGQARVDGLAPTSRPHQAGEGRLSGRAGARARAGLAGLIWAEKGFSIFLEFPIAFLFYLL
jgi:hypothetical protein